MVAVIPHPGQEQLGVDHLMQQGVLEVARRAVLRGGGKEGGGGAEVVGAQRGEGWWWIMK
jgi:hypothetical protein